MALGRMPIAQTIIFHTVWPMSATPFLRVNVTRNDAVYTHAGSDQRCQADRAERANRSAGEGAWALISVKIDFESAFGP